jgi:hypothetical protein
VLTTQHPLSEKVCTNFAETRQSYGWYSSLANWSYRVIKKIIQYLRFLQWRLWGVLSCGVQNLVVRWKKTEVSEEDVSSRGPKNKETRKQALILRNVDWNLTGCTMLYLQEGYFEKKYPNFNNILRNEIQLYCKITKQFYATERWLKFAKYLMF